MSPYSPTTASSRASAYQSALVDSVTHSLMSACSPRNPQTSVMLASQVEGQPSNSPPLTSAFRIITRRKSDDSITVSLHAKSRVTVLKTYWMSDHQDHYQFHEFPDYSSATFVLDIVVTKHASECSCALSGCPSISPDAPDTPSPLPPPLDTHTHTHTHIPISRPRRRDRTATTSTHHSA